MDTKLRDLLHTFMILTLVLFAISGCTTFHPIAVNSSYDQLAAPPDSLTLSVIKPLNRNVEYKILGTGYGESVGHSSIFGLIESKPPDFSEAYKKAVESKDGDFLILRKRVDREIAVPNFQPTGRQTSDKFISSQNAAHSQPG